MAGSVRDGAPDPGLACLCPPPGPGRTVPILIMRVVIVGAPAVALSYPVTRVSYVMSNSYFLSLGLSNNAEWRVRNIIYLFKSRLWQSLQV